MFQTKIKINGQWQSIATPIKGENGSDGITPHIGENGNWFIGDIDTGNSSRGLDGQAGPAGPQGEKGDVGSQGPKGDTGATGATGPQGPKGDTGATGARGPSWAVGSIYMSANSTSPASIFGGSWVQLKDKFLLGAGSTYTAGDAGGYPEITLTEEQMPSHTHGAKEYLWVQYGSSNYATAVVNQTVSNSYSAVTATGGGKAHSNMPPYLVVYMWQRTA